MKRLYSRLLNSSLSCAIALSVLAGPVPAATATNPGLREAAPGHGSVLAVRFDNDLLSEDFVLRLAKRPVVAWGGIRNEDGTAFVHGEFWFIVATEEAFVYYHLTEERNPNTGPTAYGGYTVKAKGIQTVSAFNFGAGEDVPVIGNDHDGFLMSTTELRVNSKFTRVLRTMDIAKGEEIFSDRLVHILDEVRSYNFPLEASAGLWMGWQALAADGSVFDDLATGAIASSSSSDCVAAAESARDFIASTTQEVSEDSQTAVQALVSGHLTTNAVLFVPGGPVGLVAPSVLLGMELNLRLALQNAVAKVMDDVTAPIYTSLAEAACDLVAGTTDADLSLINPDLPSVEDIEFAEVKTVCLKYEDEAVGSSAKPTDDGGIEVTGLSERVCTEWRFVAE